MYANRRRKKRPNYGIRTVEVARGPNGFGFTISGQQPCILSCIVSNSPADLAGLRAGDFLISVNSVSVSKITHDAVVNLIGNSVCPIKMTIAENYYSDSSDEDIDMGRALNARKPKYMHKPRIQRNYKQENRNVAFDRLLLDSSNKKVPKLRECAINHLPLESRLNVNVYNDEAAGISQNNLNISNSVPTEGIPIEFKAIVGYLGTIEMPKQLQPSSRLQTVYSCIRKLRQEKRIPTAVLMTVLPTCLTLKNNSNHILAIYPTNRVVYISSASDKDSRYFGLVTSAVCDTWNADSMQKKSENSYDNTWEDTDKKANNFEERPDIAISNSCHVFMTDPKIVDHNVHLKKAENFKVSCTTDIVTGNCLEFPKDALYIVNLVQNMYRLQNSEADLSKAVYKNNINDEVIANSPQPSASSNSDSGIGFRDDCGNVSDRILVVEFPAHRSLPVISSNQKRPNNIAASNIVLESLDLPLNNDSNYLNNVCCKNFDFKLNSNIEVHSEETNLSNLNNIRACENVSINIVEKQESEYLYEEISNRLTVRAMPNPKCIKTREISNQNAKCVGSDLRNAELEAGHFFSERPVDVPDDSYSKKSYETMSLHSAGDEVVDFKSSLDNVSVHSSKSLELNNIKTNFKTSKAKYLDNRKTNKRQLKMVSSYDDLIMDKYETSIMNYKLSPKVYGVSKPIYSCEQLNVFDAEKYGFGSLQDLSLWNTEMEKPTVAQSEPDVRIQRKSSNLNRDIKSNNNDDSEKTASWATSFEKLLESNVGLHAFAEFLKKEFSAENIYFWTACQRFKQLSPSQEKKNEAERIYQQHLCVGAIEAVNVDSQARHFAEHSLQEASNNTFELAQKQIFNLMKFDSYPRFLKSDLYKQCLSGNINDLEIDSGLLIHPISTGKLKKSLSNAEDRRRKSLLPWHRKNRAKSKDRGETEYNKKIDSSEMVIGNCDNSNDVHSSKSSLTSLDFTNQNSANGSNLDDSNNVKVPLCRVVMPSSGCTGTTVVKIKESETIQQLIDRLLEKRGLTFHTYDISTDKKLKDLDLNDSSMKLNGCQVFVEHKVSFKLDLPNRKIINIKSKPTKVLNDVVRQILLRYNYKIEDILVTHEGNIVDLQQPVTLVENCKLSVQLKEYELKSMAAPQPLKIANSKFHNLNEITNKVYEDILQEKAENVYNKAKSDKSSVKSEDWGSEHSSGILGRFLRRDSGMQEKKKKIVSKIKSNSTNSSTEDINLEHGNIITKKPLIAKWKPGVRVQMAYSESDELYEGLSRAQRFRLEDQRGTEINFELPDFLKDKKHNQLTAGSTRKMRRQDEHIFENSRFYTTDTTILSKQEKSSKNLKQEMHSNYENRTIMSTENNNVNIPNNNACDQNIGQHMKSSGSKITATKKLNSSSDESCASNQSTPTKSRLENTVIENISRSNDSLNSNKSSDPPPLPPKPKILPIKPSNWGFKNETTPRQDSVKDGLYLEQPTSSFV